jgi:hypothetical protein
LKNLKTSAQFFLILISTVFCSSCATSVGMAAAAVTSATITVGTAIVTAPFKIIGAMDGDDENDNETEDSY